MTFEHFPEFSRPEELSRWLGLVVYFADSYCSWQRGACENTNGLTGPRSLVADDTEPLPGIAPLQARVGLRWHEPAPTPDWALELECRIVDQQTRVAASLFEQRTPGFAVWNLRGFRRPSNSLTLIGGVENFTDRFYREHLDYRSGRGVFRPGINFYTAVELAY